MKVHTTNYTDSFIEVAPDCPAARGEAPPAKRKHKRVAQLQYEILKKHPYAFTSDDVLFQVFAENNDLTQSELEAARAAFFSKGQPCFRASPLTKRYGWGIHCDKDGKIALYGYETEAYRNFLEDKKLKIYKAMRSSK